MSSTVTISETTVVQAPQTVLLKAEKKGVKWEEAVVDNEHLNKKKSKSNRSSFFNSL